MGLDMTLYVTTEDIDNDNWYDSEKTHSVYWRKANAIHGFFERLDAAENCENNHVDREDVQKLLDRVTEVLDNRERAGELLPPTPGLLFGSTEIDEWYWEDMEYTKKELAELLEHDGEFYFPPWW